MSEFTCTNGHLVPPSKYYCPECGEPVVRMDGYSAREWEAMEDMEAQDGE
uniref:Uncharacterized protein n=1 Tax=viral metagenome TaxID=1070528 RepID=A0A6M3KZE0_9ZZZZ